MTGARVVLAVLDEDGGIAHRFPLAEGEHILGSGGNADVTLRGVGVSRRHARIEVLPDGGAVVADLGSKNGSFVDGRRVRRAAVGAGARLRLGTVETLLSAIDPAADGIAVAPPGDGAGETSGASVAPLTSLTSLTSPAPSTQGVAPVERAVAALRDVVVSWSGCTERGPSVGKAAVALAEAWLDRLPLAALTIVGPCSDSHLLAHAGLGPEGLGEPELVAGRHHVVHAWARLPERGGRTLDRLRPCFELAAAWLDGLAGLAEVAELAKLAKLAGRVAAGGPRERSARAADAGPPSPFGCTRLYREAAKGARGAIPILIRGESGVGKELMARFVHQRSPRAGGPFLAIHCAALSADLLEAELFGIERGVATGVEARPGLLEGASGGTLFLDEVGDMPLPLQAKVLRVLEGASFYRFGGREPVTADLRFVAATNIDLEKAVEDGGFRGDLYHRLSAFGVEVPPLRDRSEDVPPLAARFFHAALGERGVASPGITRAALGALVRYRWPGNVRELKNEIARAVLMLEPGEPLDLHHLSGRLRDETRPAPGPPLSLAGALAAAERRAFQTALAASGGDAARAMEMLDLPRSTYYRKVKELGIG